MRRAISWAVAARSGWRGSSPLVLPGRKARASETDTSRGAQGRDMTNPLPERVNGLPQRYPGRGITARRRNVTCGSRETRAFCLSRPRPSAAEVDVFVKAVNGVFERAEKDAKPDPGRVTVRRLNKAEYYNTVRDLVGVDFNPAEDFPSDDVGHGFDNIGDVLTLSPVLMERYLAAAESIVERAILVSPPPVPRRYLSGRYLQPAPPDGDPRARPRFRHLKPAAAGP